MYVSPQTGRATVNNEGRRLCISIPAKHNAFLILFLIIWLCGWFVGEKRTIDSLIANINSSSLPLLLWLANFTLGGVIVILCIFWNINGKEIIIFENDLLTIEKKVIGLGFSKRYKLSEIRDLGITKSSLSVKFRIQSDMFGGGSKDGPVVFNYGKKTIRFGLHIEKAEAEQILEAIRDNGYLQSSYEG